MKQGHHRKVFAIGNYAIKIAKSKHSKRCNIGERYFTEMLPNKGKDLIAPTICVLFNGWISIQRRCKVFDNPTWLQNAGHLMLRDLNKRISGYNIPVENHYTNVGLLNNKLVYIDYC